MTQHGATVWARQTVCSDIFANKPDKWFKIWFYIVTRANYKNIGNWERGELFIQSSEIEIATGASKDQVKKCLKWLRDEHSISTDRSTRGMHIKVIKYNVYQSLINYSSTREAPEKHQRSTPIGEEGKKVKINNELGSDNNNSKDMGWNNKHSDDYEEGVVDLDGDGSVNDPEEAAKVQDRELRDKIKHNLRLVEKPRGLTYNPAALNADIKVYQQLLKQGWSHDGIIEAYLDRIDDTYWIEERKKGNYPSLKTVEFHLRNKQPV